MTNNQAKLKKPTLADSSLSSIKVISKKKT